MKKILALTLVLIMALSLATTAFAAEGDTYSITINNKLNGHTYEAYQIFTGDLDKNSANDNVPNTNAVLSNVKWGANAKQTGAVAEEVLNGLTIENAITFVDFTTDPVATSTDEGDTYVIEGLKPGYYLIKDANDSLDEEHDAYTAYIIEVLENSTVNPKSSIPVVDKQVWDEVADAEAKHTNGWGETADHFINESFQFKLIATLSADEDYAEYEKYQVIFTDTMSAGVTFESIASVKVDGIPVDKKTGNETNKYVCTAEANQAGGSWTLTIEDIKGVAGVDLTDGAIVEVIYNAHLNENAVVGNFDSNKNTVYLEYSNNPNAGGEADFGKTPVDTVWVFTYKMDNNKVDGNNQPLGGAGFKLYSDAGCTTELPVIFDSSLNAYRLAKEGENGEEMFSAQTTGVFNIVGLDVGTYYLKETTTPDGYNTCPVVTVNITAIHAEAESETTAATEIVMTQDGTETSANKIVNKSGTVLPEAGGMGTTIFYIVGGLLAVAAVVLLITKKRMSSAE